MQWPVCAFAAFCWFRTLLLTRSRKINNIKKKLHSLNDCCFIRLKKHHEILPAYKIPFFNCYSAVVHVLPKQQFCFNSGYPEITIYCCSCYLRSSSNFGNEDNLQSLSFAFEIKTLDRNDQFQYYNGYPDSFRLLHIFNFQQNRRVIYFVWKYFPF